MRSRFFLSAYLRLKKRGRWNRAGFTLVELLTVIAIMVIMGGLMVASIGSSDAARLNTGGNTLANAIMAARQNSIARNAFTAFVVKTNTTGNYLTGDYSAYCLLQFTYNADGSPGNWTEVTPWRMLPAGIFFDKTNALTDNFLLLTSDTSFSPSLPSSFPFQGQTINLTQASTASFHIFQPDGSLVNNREMRLRLIEGAWSTSSITNKHTADKYDVLILQDTGQVTVERS